MSKDDPLEEYEDEKKKQAAARRQADVQAWEAWKSAGGDKDVPEAKPLLQPLMKRFEPSFRQKVKQWKPPSVSESAFRLDLKEQAKKALQSWDPQGGASLNTHVNNYLRKTMRYAGKRQNIARIPEGPRLAIGHIDRAGDELAEQFGRPPTPQELHAHLQQAQLPKTVAHEVRSPQHIQRIQQSRMKDIPASSFESDPTSQVTPRMSEVIGTMAQNPAAYFQPKEQAVFNAVYGSGTQQGVRTQDIAKQLNMSEQEVSKLKTKILGKIQNYL